VEVFDTLAAEDGGVLRAVKVFDALVVVAAEVGFHFQREVGVFFRFVEVSLEALVKVDVGEEGVLGNNFIENVEV